MNNVAKHAIKILNYNLTLTSDDDKSYIESVAERVERNIKTLSDAMPTRNMTEVSLFVAMDYCDRYMKAVGDGTSMRGQIKDYLKDTGAVRQQLDEARKENEQLKAEIEKLKAQISDGVSEKADTAKEPVLAPEMASDTKVFTPQINEPAKAAVSHASPVSSPVSSKEKETLFTRKKNKGKKKESKQETAPVKGVWGGDAFSESADTADDIMSFFEDRSFDDED